MKRVFSGIQPSGELHIGNYFGAIKNWVRLTTDHECLYCVVDYHAITIEYDKATMQKRIMNAAADLAACGLSETNCALFIQSDVPQHTELAWILNSVTQLGELSRMTQFKDKSQNNQKNINAGLFDYPVLQAADILIYHADIVPVGEDQVQHIELTRTIARAFNNRFGEYFREPKEVVPKTAKILGLDGRAKMSKSLGNTISLRDPEEVITRKIMKEAVTDENRKKRTDPGDPFICNLFTMHGVVTGIPQLKEIETGCKSASIGCVDCKKALLENLLKELRPIQQKIKEFDGDSKRLEQTLEAGREKASAIAKTTIAEVKNIMGLARH